MEKSLLLVASGRVLGAYGVIGTERAEFEGVPHRFVDAAAYLHQASERPLGI